MQKCPYCNGTGGSSDPENGIRYTCSICKGSGQVKFEKTVREEASGTLAPVLRRMQSGRIAGTQVIPVKIV